MQLLVFSVTPFKIDQNKNQNRSIQLKSGIWQIKGGNKMYKDPHQVSGQKNIPYTRYCFFKSASILLQWRKITFFFSGEGERRVERRVKKTQVAAERSAQIFRVSHTADYCN